MSIRKYIFVLALWTAKIMYNILHMNSSSELKEANFRRWGKRTWAEEDQAGPQGRQLNLRLEVMDLHGAEDLTHGHVQLIQTGRPAGREKHHGILSLFAFPQTKKVKNEYHRLEFFVPTFRERAGWAACRRWRRPHPSWSVSSSSPRCWRGGRWRAAASTFYLQTEQNLRGPTKNKIKKNHVYHI